MGESDTREAYHSLVQRYHAQLYRLALIVVGDEAKAETSVEQAFATVVSDPHDPEATLYRALLSNTQRSRRWRRYATSADAARAGIDFTQASDLLDLLAQRTQSERLIIGMHYLRGLSTESIATYLDTITPAHVLSQFRIDAARALLSVSHDDDQTLTTLDQWIEGRLDEQQDIEARRLVIEDEHARTQRDALTEIRALLAHAIPALFAAMPPPDLTEYLHDIGDSTGTTHLRWRPSRAQLGLVLGVFALVIAIIVSPSLTAQQPQSTAAAPLSAVEIIDASIRRFENPPLQEGILYHRYEVDSDNNPGYVIERWYDYAAPNRLKVTVQEVDGDDESASIISTDGQTILQYRHTGVFENDGPTIDIRASEEEIQSIVPMLRGMPTNASNLWHYTFSDIAPFYLKQARTNNVHSLGITIYAERPTFLLTYQTTSSLLPSYNQNETTQDQPIQVLLSIDAETYTLLDVTLLGDGTTESAPSQILRTEHIEALDQVDESEFILAPAQDSITYERLPSVQLPVMATENTVTLEETWKGFGETLLVPQTLPEGTLRGFIFPLDEGSEGGTEAGLFYEGEFQNTIIWQSNQPYDSVPEEFEDAEEYRIGSFRYRITQYDGHKDLTSVAIVYHIDQPDTMLMIMLMDIYATEAERQAQIAQIIASLTPVTPANIQELQSQFGEVPSASDVE
ncbi:MAG: hypothetical protein GFH27_549313n101 [Chloroflexi bacterium AL-W]|nr:hypothetical protein [Chloroflexi bacterium AL-N1]NOK69524.1 hypothetical protein [Chloroflexi bacterium AL-N10]NOK77489.1 hypothetical protein [Chloroflexi bacterium AL-N5]NOK84340.1 hypothetical protein [Chloroflexi bacterium AL-W]NOK91494.1 hypothetical protein [Chloroflexi bacterium AL-N15]